MVAQCSDRVLTPMGFGASWSTDLAGMLDLPFLSGLWLHVCCRVVADLVLGQHLLNLPPPPPRADVLPTLFHLMPKYETSLFCDFPLPGGPGPGVEWNGRNSDRPMLPCVSSILLPPLRVGPKSFPRARREEALGCGRSHAQHSGSASRPRCLHAWLLTVNAVL